MAVGFFLQEILVVQFLLTFLYEQIILTRNTAMFLLEQLVFHFRDYTTMTDDTFISVTL